MNMIAQETLPLDHDFPGTMTAMKQGVVAIVTDDFATVEKLASVFEFLDLRMEVVSSDSDLMHVLLEQQPMAVICDMESDEQDGFHTMKMVAGYRRDLPLLLLTGGDPVLMGAADAVQELWGLTAVSNTSECAIAGQLVAFLFTAGRHAGCMRLVPI
jgi:ActR/RegA family two-component response regulator